MWDHIKNIYSNELFCTKTKESRINEYKKKNLKMNDLQFLPNNIII